MRNPTKIHHPSLKTTVTVDERAVPIWEASGWERGPRPDTDQHPTDEPPANTAPKAGRAGEPKTPAAPPATPDA